MKFTIFPSVRAQKGELCTYEKFLEVTTSSRVKTLCEEIAKEQDAEKRAKLKKGLPIITWQAYFEGKRLNAEAQPSGLYMLDIDHIDNAYNLWSEKIVTWREKWGIVFAGMTASQHGLRLVAKCRPEFTTIAECQRWLAKQIGVEFDDVCKDFARSSFVVRDEYTYFMDGKLFSDEPEPGTVYDINAKEPASSTSDLKPFKEEMTIEQTETLFGPKTDYKGVPYEDIINEWLEMTGGAPQQGERNAKLYKLASRLRYITDFNEATMLRVMPRFGLDEAEMKTLIHSAVSTPRASEMPKDMRDVLNMIDRRAKLTDGQTDLPDIITDTKKIPSLPPVIRQFVDNAPDDFKMAVALCQLPILGALGSRLRARYLDGRLHEPSFQVSLEAPQASGKSFMSRLAEKELEQMIIHDQAQREKELEYDKKVRELKLLNVKINVDNKDEILGSRPQSLIRYLSPKVSVTKLLMRMKDAQGLHLFAMATEIDTVTKAFKTGFSSYSDLLRNAFDNDTYGQDYASENSFSGIVNVRYNVLFSGTPKAMRRFYPDVEDGLVSRVCFVTLPDQFGKPMPVWKELDAKQQVIVDTNLVRLNEISIIGDDVQPEHEMKLGWLNKEMEKWLLAQQAEAVKDDDRTRDIFCRRSAVVGFRAGMLAFFLWGEKNTPPIRKNVVNFAQWVANSMLNQHLLRFNVQNTYSNVNPWESVYNGLKEEFTREELEQALMAEGVETPVKNVIYKWRLLGTIEVIGTDRDERAGNKQSIKFKKVKV